MKHGYDSIIASRWLKSILVLTLVYYSQINPLAHVHHDHESGLFEFEISAHPVEADTENSSDHHHDGNRPHKDDHSHTFNEHVDWHRVRALYTRTPTPDVRYLYSVTPDIIIDNANSRHDESGEPLFIREYYACDSMLRAPPVSA